ncbi:DUF4157 domain-containing protein [Chitinophaga lutea]
MSDIRCKIRERSTVAKLAAWRMKAPGIAIVFGRVIHLHGVSREAFLRDERWVRHEVRHVRQYRRHGFIVFLWLYLADWVRSGYYNNRFEREARQAESNPRELEGVEIG